VTTFIERPRLSVVVATWASGGNLPPLLALARILRSAKHRVQVLTSSATDEDARRGKFETVAYRAAPEPDRSLPFEAQVPEVLQTLAGVDIARDAYDVIEETRPDMVVSDCMLPAAIVAAQAASTPVVSIIHFLYGPPRVHLARTNEGWTTDLEQLTRPAGISDCAPFATG
jgi:hypothetical protein